MLPKLSLVLGGAASGKSAFAESLITTAEAPRVYIATAQAFDDEMRAKIRAHINTRGAHWRTVETSLNAADALQGVAEHEVVLLDCATMWLSNHLLEETHFSQEEHRLLSALAHCKGRVVVVSNEVGSGIVPDNKLARHFREAQGNLNQKIAAQAQFAALVVAGLPMVLKGQMP